MQVTISNSNFKQKIEIWCDFFNHKEHKAFTQNYTEFFEVDGVERITQRLFTFVRINKKRILRLFKLI